MSLPLSRLCAIPIEMPNGTFEIPTGIYVDSQTGKVTGILTLHGVLSPDAVIEKKHGWKTSGDFLHDTPGENWKEFSVCSKTGTFYGNVQEIWIDPLLFVVTKIECQKSILLIPISKRIFSFQDIQEVIPEKKMILVQDDNRVFIPKEELSPYV
ncbi:hypothetical protein HZA38_00865 [Candidatus Peregrinibacteria bacterium]|nr:hypothetical protein [Candidatus Peregrinibacteria bacterium]